MQLLQKFTKKSIKFWRDFAKFPGFEAVQRNANLVDFEKCWKMRKLSSSEVSIQKRTSLPKFLWNRGPKQELHPSSVDEFDGENPLRRRWLWPRSPSTRLRSPSGGHSSRGSFSAVSTPIFAIKYSFFSIFRDLQNDLAEFSKIFEILHTFCKIFVKIQQKFSESGKFAEILQKFTKFCKIL